MKIHAHIIAFNEEKILPFTLDYYSIFCEKIFVYDNMSTDSSDEIYKKYPKVEVIKWDSNNEINEFNYIRIKSNEYRNRSRNQDVDWVIVCDCDEFLYHPNLIEVLSGYKERGITVAKTSGHEMVSEVFPEYDGKLLIDKVRIGSDKMNNLSKCLIFNPNINVSYDIGAHGFSSNNSIFSEVDEIKVLHYKFLGKDYVKEIYRQRYERLGQINRQNQWGIHYSQIEKVHQMMDDIINKNNEIV
jgi:hypothetical protein